jgi:phage baseplate assembly protein W
MTNHGNGDIVGQGWAFPPRIGTRGGLALTGDRNEIDEAIRIILSTSPGQRVMRTHFGCRLRKPVFASTTGRRPPMARHGRCPGDVEPSISLQRVDVQPDPDNHNCRGSRSLTK